MLDSVSPNLSKSMTTGKCGQFETCFLEMNCFLEMKGIRKGTAVEQETTMMAWHGMETILRVVSGLF